MVQVTKQPISLRYDPLIAVKGSKIAVRGTDEELAADDVDGELLARFPIVVWARLRQSRLDLAVLVAAERGGTALMVLLSCGLPESATRSRPT